MFFRVFWNPLPDPFVNEALPGGWNSKSYGNPTRLGMDQMENNHQGGGLVQEKHGKTGTEAEVDGLMEPGSVL